MVFLWFEYTCRVISVIQIIKTPQCNHMCPNHWCLVPLIYLFSYTLDEGGQRPFWKAIFIFQYRIPTLYLFFLSVCSVACALERELPILVLTKLQAYSVIKYRNWNRNKSNDFSILTLYILCNEVSIESIVISLISHPGCCIENLSFTPYSFTLLNGKHKTKGYC